MLTLFQVNVVANSGSTGRIAEGIGQIALENGWRSYIAYGRWDCGSSSELIKIGTKLDTMLHGLQTRLFDRHGLASVQSTLKLIEKIQKIQPDIIHLHNIHGYYLNIPLFFRFLLSSAIPVVWTLHDCWSYTGHCTYYSFDNCRKWETACKNCPLKKEYPASLFLDRSSRNYVDKKEAFTSMSNMTLVPVSYWLAKEIERSFLNSFPIKMIHNGLDLDLFNLDSSSSKERYGVKDKFVILGVANGWSPRKGLKDFLSLAQRISVDYIIILIGLDKKQIDLLPDNIIGISRTESISQLVGLYSLADVFINPTWEDNYPTTNMESIACGTPVITYNTGGSGESIAQGTGYVIPQGDMDELLNTIHRIKQDGKSYYTQKCREYALMHFNQKDRYNEYIQLYNQILGDKKQ